eukprot:g1968.t1
MMSEGGGGGSEGGGGGGGGGGGANTSGKSTVLTAKSGPRFELKSWNGVAMWSWDICTDTCAICRNKLTEPSIEYQRWLKTRNTCPICSKEWDYAKMERILDGQGDAPAEADGDEEE